MATIKAILDTRTEKKGSLFPLKLYLSHQRKIKYIGLSFDVMLENWNGSQVVDHPDAAKINRHIKNRIKAATGIITLLEIQDKLKRIDIKELLYRIENQNQEPEPEDKQISICKHFKTYIAKRKTPRTAEIYTDTLRKIIAYSGEKTTFSQVNKRWLESFELELLKINSVNTVAIDMRNIRAVFNDAIDDDIIDQNLYPFRKFKISTEETRKRALTIEQLRLIRDYEVQEHQQKYRDLFMLTFYLIGINPIDLLQLKSIKNGRIEYRRAKTGKLYDIKVEPEAFEIIERYRGKNYLLDVMDSYSNYKDFVHRWNENLQAIGPVEWIWNNTKTKRNRKKITPLFPELSIYWARHTWAQTAKKIKIEKSTISDCLGHKYGSKTTGIYLDVDLDLIDDANRRVIDYLFSDPANKKGQ